MPDKDLVGAGGRKMEEAKLMKTKSGNGFKILVHNEWLYTSSREMEMLLDGAAAVVTFRKIAGGSSQEYGAREAGRLA